jgi:putative ABC transport system permease protein
MQTIRFVMEAIMDAFLKDVRFGIRSLLKQPGFTAIAVITLALGLGANTAIFSFVNGMLLRPLPFPQSDRLVVLSEKNPEKNIPPVVSPRNLEDWEQQSRTIEQFGAWRDWHFRMTTQEGTTGTASAICSPSLFQVLRVQPVQGRLFLPEENQPGHDHVVMISSRYWKSRFDTDEKVVGQTITLDKQLFTIIGVEHRSRVDRLWHFDHGPANWPLVKTAAI